MNILHLASSNRWTGAAAPALAEVEALRRAGVEAHFAYVGGYKFEQRLGSVDWAHPIIRKHEDPISIRRSVAAVRQIVDQLGIDILHAHLTYDHWLARLAARGRASRILRTYHSRRTLRGDPATRWLMRATSAVCVVNQDFLSHRLLKSRQPYFMPPPVDHGFFREIGRDETRRVYGFEDGDLVLGVIGKVAEHRGFEQAIETFRRCRAREPRAKLLIVGHGPHRPALEKLISGSGISGAVTWAGYREPDLPEHFSAMDALLFTRTGSDEGHRAVIEAMACGTAVFAYPLEGITALFGARASEFVADRAEPAALADLLLKRVQSPSVSRSVPRELSLRFGYDEAAERLLSVYRSI